MQFTIVNSINLDFDKYKDVLSNLIYEGMDLQDFKDYLESCDIYKVYIDTEECGFFSVESISDTTVEVHSFIKDPFKRYSSYFLREMIVKILKYYSRIITTVTSDYQYIVRFLKMLGFSEYMLLKNAIIKDGINLDITYLELNKGDI